MVIGILALQGNVCEHRENLERYGAQNLLIRRPDELDGIDGLILPGGESTAMRKLIVSSGLKEPLRELILQGLPVWGTCAGVVLLAEGGIWQSVDIQVERNAYGSQIHSRVAKGISKITDREFSMVFIRAPRIRSFAGNVEILAELEGDIVAVRQNNILLTTFHPELTEDSPFTEYFLNIVDRREA
ncbi:MAG TPA: pyridoxal 5'-phosphate synthase glutaminase subunit PdxT [Desulfomonilia bacterium]|nr:pyridoxal 5'-phosphate synthase glutaminase subunit PdxT [Desulfomonilia bacterium]